MEAIAIRVGAIAIRVEAIAIGVEAIAIRVGAIAIRLDSNREQCIWPFGPRSSFAIMGFLVGFQLIRHMSRFLDASVLF